MENNNKLQSDISRLSDSPVISGIRMELYMSMYEIAKQHKDKAIEAASHNNLDYMKNEIDESMISLLFSYTCLEAYINTIGMDRLGKDWTRYEGKNISTEAKWIGISNALASKKYGKPYSIFKKRLEPFKSFLFLKAIREEYIVHRKAQFGKGVPTNYGNVEGTITILNHNNAEMACNVVREMVIKLHDNIDNPPPIVWLNR